MKLYLHKLLIATALLISACSGSNSTPQEEPIPQPSELTTLTGTFIDAAVVNIDYQTETQNGVTDDEGQFKYLEGESVTFSIGEIAFPTIAAQETITPISLAQASDTENDLVINVARFLQSVDSSSESDTIVISEDLKASAQTEIDFAQSVETFADNDEVAALVSASSLGELVTIDESLQHLERNLDEAGVISDKAISTWVNETFDANDNLFEIVTLTFLNDGSYLFGQVESYALPPNGSTLERCYGFEFEQYDVDKLTRSYDFMLQEQKDAISETVNDDDRWTNVMELIIYDNGYHDDSVCGFEFSISAATFQDAFEQNRDNVFNHAYLVDGNDLIFFANERTGEADGDVEQYNPVLFKQQATETNPLIGTWLSSDHRKMSADNREMEPDLFAIVFTASGHYLLMEANKADEGDGSGVEVGKYHWNASEQTLTFSAVPNNQNPDNGEEYTFDNNGNAGVNLLYGQALNTTIINGIMKITILEDGETEVVTLLHQ